MGRKLSTVLQAGLADCSVGLIAAGIFSSFINLLTIAIPLYSIQVYDRVLVSGSAATLAVLSLAAGASLLTSALLEDVRGRLLISIGRLFDVRLAVGLFERQVEQAAAGNATARDQSLRDLDNVRHLLTGSGTLALLDLPWTPIFILACFFLHPALGLLTLFGTVLLIGLAIFNQWYVADPLNRSGLDLEVSYKLTGSVMRNAEAVQAMGMLPDIIAKWGAGRANAINRQALASFRNSWLASLIKFLRYSLQLSVIALGAWLAVNRDLSPGSLFAASLLFSRALQPIDQIVGVWRQLISGWAALGRVERALELPVRPRAMRMPAPTGRLTAENLTYVPPGGRTPILSNVSFDLEPGKALGIVGASAAGKSTLARMIVGATKPTSGIVRLDGADVYSWDRAAFGKVMGYVPQDLQLFEGTIKDNISRFRDADGEAIVAAARLARVHKMILTLPQAYETVLDANGAPLSGGQRQRLALARAIFGNPRVVVLDEPNSNLDGEGEAALREIVADLKASEASLVMIAHRPSVLVGLDMVLVLANGTAVDYGPVERIMPRIAPGFTPLRAVGARA